MNLFARKFSEKRFKTHPAFQSFRSFQNFGLFADDRDREYTPVKESMPF